MSDRWDKDAAKIVFEFESRIQAGEFDANTASDTLRHLIATALSDAYEAGRRKEREACAVMADEAKNALLQLASTKTDALAYDALCMAADVMELHADAIRSREAGE